MSEMKRYAIDTLGGWEAIPVNAGFFVKFTDHAAALDAQRLRADTAETELKREKEFHAVKVSESERMLAAAEQRIAELKAVLERMLEDDDMPVHWFAQRIDAALNPNPEAESHE